MFRVHARQRFTAWIACLAVLLGALMPAIGQAMVAAGDSSGHWLEICTAMGLERIAVTDGSDEPDGSPSDASAAHCPYCLTHAGSFALPPVELPAFPVLGGADVLPTLFFLAPRPLFAWASSRSRAPPPFA